MATGNFYNENANKIFAVCMDYEQPVLDDDGNETDEMETVSCSSYDYDDTKSNVIHEAKALAKEKNYGFSEHWGLKNNLRSYEGSGICCIYDTKRFGDINVTVTIGLVIRGAYYEGANLDWEYQYEVEGKEMDEIEFIEDFDYYSDMNAGLKKIQGKNAEKWAEKTFNKLVAEVETMYEKISMPLTVSARFSNGETMYSKA